jgi:hypothetical protein
MGDPLAEPLAAVLGAGLALLTLLVPLLTVLSDRREWEADRQSTAPSTVMLRSERLDARADGRGTGLR